MLFGLVGSGDCKHILFYKNLITSGTICTWTHYRPVTQEEETCQGGCMASYILELTSILTPQFDTNPMMYACTHLAKHTILHVNILDKVMLWAFYCRHIKHFSKNLPSLPHGSIVGMAIPQVQVLGMVLIFMITAIIFFLTLCLSGAYRDDAGGCQTSYQITSFNNYEAIKHSLTNESITWMLVSKILF